MENNYAESSFSMYKIPGDCGSGILDWKIVAIHGDTQMTKPLSMSDAEEY